MGQIVKRKKKGRPSKADLARRNISAEAPRDEAPEPNGDLRRSLRRRNVKYIFDFDDYIDDEEEFEDERRREKKLKLLLSLHTKEGGAESGRNNRRVSHAPVASTSSSDHGKQGTDGKVDGDDEIDGADDGNNDNGNDIDDEDVDDEVNLLESE